MDTIGDWLLLTLYWFLFIGYLIVLWQILTDLFRDHELSGWWKAVWIIFLFVVPLITALIYVIARGKGMARRQVSAVAQAKSDTDQYIRSVAGKSAAESIADAKALLDQGVIDQAEFAQLKAKALA